MHPRPFTSKTRVALAIARGIAAARGDRDITPTHIAAGIFREGSNLGLAALWYAGLSETAIKTLGGEFERSLPKPPGDVQPRQVTVDLTAGEAVITNQAELEMDRLEDPYLGTEHFLLAILRSHSAVTDRLEQLGITVETLDAGLAASKRGDPPPQHAKVV